MSVDPSQFPTASAPVASEAPTVAELEAKVASLETELASESKPAEAVAPVTPPKPSLADRLKELVFGENKQLDEALSTLGAEGYANDPLVAVVEVLVKAVLG